MGNQIAVSLAVFATVNEWENVDELHHAVKNAVGLCLSDGYSIVVRTETQGAGEEA